MSRRDGTAPRCNGRHMDDPEFVSRPGVRDIERDGDCSMSRARQSASGTRRRTMGAGLEGMFVSTGERHASGVRAQTFRGSDDPLCRLKQCIAARRRINRVFQSDPPTSLGARQIESVIGCRCASDYKHQLRRASVLTSDQSIITRQIHASAVLRRNSPAKFRRSPRFAQSIS